MSDGPKPLPHTQCVKGKYWYFRAPKTRAMVKMEGQPGDPYFMEMYRRLMSASGATLKRQKQKSRIKEAEARAAVSNEAQVYFVQMGVGGPIKIGKALNVQRRIGVLQVGFPIPLTLLAVCDGGVAREREYHARFAAARLRGEWFDPVPDLLLEVSRLERNRPVS